MVSRGCVFDSAESKNFGQYLGWECPGPNGEGYTGGPSAVFEITYESLNSCAAHDFTADYCSLPASNIILMDMVCDLPCHRRVYTEIQSLLTPIGSRQKRQRVQHFLETRTGKSWGAAALRT